MEQKAASLSSKDVEAEGGVVNGEVGVASTKKRQSKKGKKKAKKASSKQEATEL